MRRRHRIGQNQCWVDIFECDQFRGRLRRVFGPVELPDFSAGSVIVGPQAQLLLTVKRQGRQVIVRLKPKLLVPDLATSLRRGKIQAASVSRDQPEKSVEPRRRRDRHREYKKLN